LKLTALALEGLLDIPQVKIIGPTDLVDRGGIISFTLADLHPHDVGQVLDEHGIAVRVGHHCAWPVCTFFQVPATTRASFYVYNEERDIEMLLLGVKKTLEYFGVT
jgi:cysteine desulfurase/selenocysteine lyase